MSPKYASEDLLLDTGLLIQAISATMLQKICSIMQLVIEQILT